MTGNKFDHQKTNAIRHPIKPAETGTRVPVGWSDSVEFWYTVVFISSLVTLSEMRLVIGDRINRKINGIVNCEPIFLLKVECRISKKKITRYMMKIKMTIFK